MENNGKGSKGFTNTLLNTRERNLRYYSRQVAKSQLLCAVVDDYANCGPSSSLSPSSPRSQPQQLELINHSARLSIQGRIN